MSAVARQLYPLIDPAEYPAPIKATMLTLERVDWSTARTFIAAWHSHLPITQRGPWRFAFVATFKGTVFAAALWNNPSARTLPQTWIELHRMAVAPDAPHCTASWFLQAMVAWIARNDTQSDRAISYQDSAVHKGTIYKAAGWTIDRVQAARTRDRSKPRAGTLRAYRSNLNGVDCDASEKVRWSTPLATTNRARLTRASSGGEPKHG